MTAPRRPLVPSRQVLGVATDLAAARSGEVGWRSWQTAGRPTRNRAAAWCLGFAGVSAWQVAADLTGPPDPRQRYAAYASGLAVMGVLIGVLKPAGAAVALAAVLLRPGRAGWPRQLLGVALWGVLTVWFHPRHRLRWPAAVAGLAGAPLLLGLLLGVVPALLGRWGLLPN